MRERSRAGKPVRPDGGRVHALSEPFPVGSDRGGIRRSCDFQNAGEQIVQLRMPSVPCLLGTHRYHGMLETGDPDLDVAGGVVVPDIRLNVDWPNASGSFHGLLSPAISTKHITATSDKRSSGGLLARRPRDAVATTKLYAWSQPELAPSRHPSRSSRFVTVETCQRPPRRVSMPRAFSSAAIVLRLVAPPGANVLHHRRQVPGVPVGVPRDRRSERRTALAGPPERRGAVWVAQPHAAAPCHAQRLLGAPGDRLALLLRHERHDPDREVVRLRQVDRGEPHAAVPAASAGRRRCATAGRAWR